VAWAKVQRPLELGGLGVLNLKMFGLALCTRWLWLQRTDPSRPWSELPIKDDPATKAFFNNSVMISLGDGNSLLFWRDAWLRGQTLSNLVPDLVGAVSSHR
jgi:hypothetical protein